MGKKRLTRDIIIQTLVDALKPIEYVLAFWEGGAAAFNRVDEWSDIDLYLVVDDKKVDETFVAFEKALKSLSLFNRSTACHIRNQGFSKPSTNWKTPVNFFY